MPLYEYLCDKCDTKFEALRPFSRMDDPALCPKGHTKARRVLSTFAAVTRDGYGELPERGGGGCGGGCSGCNCGAG